MRADHHSAKTRVLVHRDTVDREGN